jgi:hypothetical protein
MRGASEWWCIWFRSDPSVGNSGKECRPAGQPRAVGATPHHTNPCHRAESSFVRCRSGHAASERVPIRVRTCCVLRRGVATGAGQRVQNNLPIELVLLVTRELRFLMLLFKHIRGVQFSPCLILFPKLNWIFMACLNPLRFIKNRFMEMVSINWFIKKI